MFECDHCHESVAAHDGYIHRRIGGTVWRVHHKACAPDLTRDYCVSVPATWHGLLDMHYAFAVSRSEVRV